MPAKNMARADKMFAPVSNERKHDGLTLLHVTIQIPLGDFTFSTEPNIGELLCIADTLLVHADIVWPAANVRVYESIDQLRTSIGSFGIHPVERRLKTLEEQTRRVLGAENEA